MLNLTRLGPGTSQTTLEALRQLATATFLETYHPPVPLRPLEVHVAEAFELAKLERDVADPEVGLFLATSGGRTPSGYLKIVHGLGRDQKPDPHSGYLERSYLSKSAFGSGMGSALMEAGLELAREWQVKSIWLRVWVQNHRAIAFYEKWGFVKTGETTFEVDLGNGTLFSDRNFVMERAHGNSRG